MSAGAGAEGGGGGDGGDKSGTAPFDSCHSMVIRNQQNMYLIFLLLP